MKYFWVIPFVLVVGCGKITLQSDSQFNSLISIDPKALSSTDKTNMDDICNAVRTKTQTISSLVGTTFVFTGSSKSCTATSSSPLPDSTVTLVNQGGLYKFNEGSNAYYFSDVETYVSGNGSTGIISEICQTGTSQSPYTFNSSEYTSFTTTELSSSDCAIRSNEEVCLKVEKSIKTVDDQGQSRGKVFSREWIRIRLDQPNQGFFNYRRKMATANCIDGQFIDRTATLK